MLADMNVLVRHIRRLAAPNRYARLNDRTLLDCFAREGDQEAFAALVNRHALLVAGVCRRVLANSHDVEDVFQNTFLTLARKAGKIGWHESVANWLHGVAHRLALRSRSNTIRREELHEAAREKLAARELDRQTQELRSVLDAELSELADRLRLPLVLCYLEGRTRDEAARHCGWSLRTLERRLEQGRSLLRKRCLRHGLDLSVILLAAALADQQASARGLLVAKTMDTLRAAINAGTLGSAVALQATQTVSLAATGYLKLAGGLSLMLTFAAFGTYAWTGHVNARPSLVAEPNIPTIPNDDRKEPVPVARPGQQATPPPVNVPTRGQFRASGVSMVRYSGDGKRLIAVGSGGLQVFDAATGNRLLHTLQREPAVSGTVSISDDGWMATLADPTGLFQGDVFDTESAGMRCRLQIPEKRAMKRACFSRDDRFLAALVNETSVDLYDTFSGRFIRSIQWKENFVPDEKQTHLGEVGFLPDGKSLIVSVHASGIVRVFDFTTGKETRQIVVSPKGMAGMVLSPDGRVIVALPNSVAAQPNSGFSEQPDETVLVFSTATGERIKEFKIPRVSPSMLVIGPDNNTLFAGGSKTARTGIGRWNLSTGAYLNSVFLPWPHPNNMPLAISPNGKILLCYCDSTLHQIEIASGRTMFELPGHHGAITCVDTSSKHYATGSVDGKVVLWDRASGKPLFEVGEPGRSVQKVLLDSKADAIFALYAMRDAQFDDANLRAYRVSDGKMLWQLHPPLRDHLLQRNASLALNGNQLAVLNSHSITYIQADTGRIVCTDPLPKKSAEVSEGNSPSVSAMVYSKEQEKLLIWTDGDLLIGNWPLNQVLNAPLQLQTKRTAFNLRARGVAGSSAAFSLDGRLLAFQLPIEGTGFILLDVATGEKIQAMQSSQRYPISMLAFSSNTKELAWMVKQSGGISLTNVSTGVATNGLTASGKASAFAFTEDGKVLFVGCDDSTALVWDLNKLPAAK